MPYILCIDTSTTNCSVALVKGETLVVLKEDYNTQYSHAERLHVYIGEVLQTAGITFQELAAIAVSMGPGSYTGLRIGVSAVKGLCYALEIPMIALPTLTVLAHQIKTLGGIIIPLLDARRMEVYSAIFDACHVQVRDTQAQLLDEHTFQAELDQGKVHFIGNGVAKFSEICTHPNAVFNPNQLPSAQEMGTLAWAKYKTQDFEDVAYFEPYYLKDFVASNKKKA